jgi:hypothetical protein
MTKLSSDQAYSVLNIIKQRFEKNINRHPGIEWEKLKLKLENNPIKLYSLFQMEDTGGEPDIIAFDKSKEEYIFCDCSAESPIGRRNTCYDKAALDSRKSFKPVNNAVDMAASMGITIMDEAEYRELQTRGKFDMKTSSWLKTPDNIRKLGGAIFGDYRYDTVFIYHNGAQSYYAARGFRGILRV